MVMAKAHHCRCTAEPSIIHWHWYGATGISTCKHVGYAIYCAQRPNRATQQAVSQGVCAAIIGGVDGRGLSKHAVSITLDFKDTLGDGNLFATIL